MKDTVKDTRKQKDIPCFGGQGREVRYGLPLFELLFSGIH